MIDFNISCNTVEEAIAEMKVLSAALGGGLPPMQEQPKENREPPAETTTRKPRAKKDEAAKQEAGEAAAGESTSSVSTDPSPSTSTSADTASSTAAEVPDIELVRAKLKQLGATDGLGHDKVFELLGKVKATNASSVPTEKRAELIAEIDALLAANAK